MDSGPRQAVQQLLRPTDTCILAVQGQLLGSSDPNERLYAVIKHETRQEYALFIFSVDRLEQPPCYMIAGVYPIRGHFTAHTQVIKDGWSQVLVGPGDGSTLLLNLPGNQFPQVFISQLNKATHLFNQSVTGDSTSVFDWLQGYEVCRSGWDRFSKPGQPPPTTSSTNPFGEFGEGPEDDPLQAALPEWPWSHIITPNSDGSTDVATCEHFPNLISEFDPLLVKNENPSVSTEIAVTPSSNTNQTPNPFAPVSSNPFSSSSHSPLTAPSFPPSSTGMRACISESNLRHLETETSRHVRLRGDTLIARSTDNLTASEEVDRHCVAAGMRGSGRSLTNSGSVCSLSDGEHDNGGIEFSPSVHPPACESGVGKKTEMKTVRADQRYSKFEVITDGEVVEATGRRRLNRSPDFRNLRKTKDTVKMRFKKPTGSQTGVSKANMDQPELSSKPSPRQRTRAETRASSSHWVSRYRPGIHVPMNNVRESFVQAELRLKEKEFCNKKPLRVFCGTWNVNGKPPPSSLNQFLLEVEGQGDSGVVHKPDIYVIGFQELDLSAQVLVGAESSREEPWIRAVEDTLKMSGTSYHKLLHLRLVGIMLLVYIRPYLLPHVSDHDIEYVTTGIGGVLGNKGAVGARFNLYHSSFCFVNCHFAASMEEVDKRNHDYHTIRNKMLFDKCNDYKYTIMEHDMVFWLGDMNYRIQTSSEMTAEMIKANADAFQITSLLKQDQLVLEMTKGNIFTDFAEGGIDFKPTYKYDPNTDNWDTSDKHRPPAWTDRVLYAGMGAELRGYRSHPKMKISDHKPVSAVFACDVRVVDPVREKEVLEEITRGLDKLENDTLPKVDLSQREFNFTDVKFQVPQTQRLTVTNTGHRPVLVSFIPKLDEETYSKPWLEAKPSSAVIQPMQDVVIVLTVMVDCDSASSLNSGQNQMDDILVLHLEGGKDFFISVAGNYLPSCFGSSLETLVHLHTYIREVPTADLIDLSLTSSWDRCTLTQPPAPSFSSPSPSPSPRAPSPSLLHTAPPHDIPKELFQIVSFLNTYALKQENLFQEGGRQIEMQQIRDALDIGGSRELPGSAHSMANCLLLFLSALSEPVIPVPLHQRAIDCCNQPMLCKQLLLSLSRVHQRTFIFIISFLKRLLSNSEDNGLDAKLLATIFGDILLRTPAHERRTRSKKQLSPLSRKKATFVYQFLVADLTVDYR